MTDVSAIVAAGGRGTRLGRGGYKQLVDIGGRTMLARSLEPFDACDAVREIIVVLPADQVDSPPMLDGVRTRLRFVAGGARRQDSVAAGLDAVAPTTDIVVVHDAARPFCSVALIERTVAAAVESGAAIAALSAPDTVKEGRVEGAVQHTVVSRTLARDRLFLAQTPQAFRLEVLRAAVHVGREAGEATDEATLAERAGHQVRLVEGESRNFKVTTEDDLRLARQIADRGGPSTRVGLGYDLHRLVSGRRLVLGGVEIPGDRGLDGHSDADAVCHAVTDAVLGAVNAGDIGSHFPDDDPRWKDSSSIELLRQAVEMVGERGYVVSNVDIVVVAEWPKIRAYGDRMRARLAGALAIAPDQIGLKGKTGEGVGAVGRGEAIVVHAIAAVRAG